MPIDPSLLIGFVALPLAFATPHLWLRLPAHRRTRVLVAGALVLATTAVVTAAVALPPALRLLTGAALTGLGLGGLFTALLAFLITDRIPVPAKGAIAFAGFAFTVVRGAAALDVGGFLEHDLAMRVLVDGTEAIGLGPSPEALRAVVAFFLPSIELVRGARPGAVVFLAGLSTVILFGALPLVLPARLAAELPHTSIRDLRLPGAPWVPLVAGVVCASLLLGTGGDALPVPLQMLLGAYAAVAVAAAGLTAARVPAARPWVATAGLVTALHLPLIVLWSFGGILDHALDLRMLIPGAPADRHRLRFRWQRRPAALAAAVVLAVVVPEAAYVLFTMDIDDRDGALAPDRLAPAAGGPELPGAVIGGPTAGMVRIASARGPFWIDAHEHPNLRGRVPTAGLGSAEAAGLCAAAGKRLCTEAEWTIACMDGRVLGQRAATDPREICAIDRPTHHSGALEDCRTSVGVHDLVGGVWEWTGHPGPAGLHVLKGHARTSREAPRPCTYRLYVHELQEPLLPLEAVGVRCCRDGGAGTGAAVAQASPVRSPSLAQSAAATTASAITLR